MPIAAVNPTANAISAATPMAEAHHADGVKRQRVLVVGLGTMGMSHARAYRAIEGFELAGLCTRNAAARRDLDPEFPGCRGSKT